MLPFNTPLTRNITDEQKGYLFIDDLLTKIYKCQDEAVLYLVEKKYGTAKQQSLDFKAGEEE